MGENFYFEKIRKPAVAGSFYPVDKKTLEEKLDLFLKIQKKLKIEGKPRILIVPPAGIDYSGQTAAWGFVQIEGEDFEKVILLGASHQHWFSYGALDEVCFWQTPLGKAAVDGKFVSFLVDGEKIVKDSFPFAGEHCLEMELVFFQKVLKNFKIIPVLVSEVDESLAYYLAKKLSNNFDEKTLLVVSSDLSHYPPYNLAKIADGQTIEGILTGKKKVFVEKIGQVESKGYFDLETAACGQKAIGWVFWWHKI